MNLKYPVGSTLKLESLFSTITFTATEDLRELYFDLFKFARNKNVTNIKCFKTVLGNKTEVPFEREFFELEHELTTIYPYSIEYINPSLGIIFVYCSDTNEVLSTLEEMQKYRLEGKLDFNTEMNETVVVHNHELPERIEDTIQNLIEKYKPKDVKQPVSIELKLDYVKEFGTLLNEVINGATSEDRNKAKYILTYLTDKLSEQKNVGTNQH